MKQKPLKDSDNNPVFVKDTGEYSYTFPREHIVNRDTELSGYTVYFFVPNGDSYRELSARFEKEEKALKFATNIYGKEITLTNSVKGIVFEVEVHNN
jgi:hypothetical protein